MLTYGGNVVSSIGGSKAYSYLDQLLGITKQTANTAVIAPAVTPVKTETNNPTASTGSKPVQLSQTILDLLKGGDKSGLSSLFNTNEQTSQIDNSPLAQLIGTAKKSSKNPYSDMLSANSMSALYKTAFNGTLQKNQQEALLAIGSKGILA